MDIKVSGRTITSSELMLGARGDNNVESIRFLIPRMTSAGVDLSQGIGYAVFKLPSGTDGQVSMTPEVIDDDMVALTLLVGSQMTEEKGRGKLALKISGLESVMWSSGICDTFVVNTIDMPSPQPFSLFRAMTVGTRIAEPETENPLTVTERTINVPAELQTIAVASDENSETVNIVVPRYFDGQDLSVYDFILHTEMAGNGIDDILFNNQNGQMKAVEDSTVTLTWVLRPPQTSYEGKLSIQLFVQGESFAWHSLIAELSIAKHLTGESVVPATPSMYEQWLAQLNEEVGFIRKYDGVLTDISDNIDAVVAAPAAATRAEQAAKKAEEAAKQSLGFRTFFSVISPDANGDLDPSRPMTTPAAASVTVKSKGDRIQSVRVDGFTQQVVGGLRLFKYVLTGNEIFAGLDNGYCNIQVTPSPYPHGANGYGLANYLPYKYNSNLMAFFTGLNVCVVGRQFMQLSDGTVSGTKAYCKSLYDAGKPLVFWYPVADESQSTGLYIPIQTQGHEYRCKLMELTAPLYAGDTIESCVPSGCDKTMSLDGSTVTVTASGSSYVATAANAVAGGTVYASGLANLSLLSGQVSIPAASFPSTVTSAQTANTWLQSNPQTVYYQSTSYTEQSDIYVELETHSGGAVYAHPAVEPVAVPYTEADVTAANHLAATPSTLPYIEDADVPMLLDAAEPMAAASTLASTLPVAGTYVVSSQDGTTVAVSLKAMQDGGDAATLGGLSLDDIKQLISDAVAAALKQ